MEIHPDRDGLAELDSLAVLGMIHDTVKQVDCIGYLAKRLADAGEAGASSRHSDATAIRHLTHEVTARLRRFLDTSVAAIDRADRFASVREILEHASRLIAIAHPAAIIESTTSASAAAATLPRAMADLLVPLLDNAITHGASPHPTRLVTALAQGRLSISVADSGPGMPPDTLAACQRVGFTTGPRGQHHGIGLAAVASLTRHMGGTLRIESEAGRGTAVTLELPVGMDR